ncbi:MAG: cytochrome c-type biogenesis protein CcmH [Pyrinomonadaceae bacterium]|nr:cytochrome c-type biogenesis protein CcmH [Pyrinomonadaceae bacterium]
MRRFAMPILLLCIGFLALSAQVTAQEAKALAEDPELEKRVMSLSEELRCLVCQNETLAASQADLAVDLRREIREQLKAGKSEKEIITFLTARYGDFVLYRPRVTPATYLLWFGPFALMVIGLGLLFYYLKQRRELISQQPLSPEEHHRAEELLKVAPEKEPA